MNLILVILEFLWGLVPRERSELQLVPVYDSRSGAFGRHRRIPRLFWSPRGGWLRFHFEILQCETGIKRSQINFPLLGFDTRGWRRLRMNRRET